MQTESLSEENHLFWVPGKGNSGNLKQLKICGAAEG